MAALLAGALRREGLERIRIAAVANDTVATLMLQSYRARGRSAEARPADVGLILGTGANLAADLGPAGIRNLESGNFDGVAGVETPYDAALDRELAEPSPGEQRFEKMVSGHYLGEILRRTLRDLGARAHARTGRRRPARRPVRARQRGPLAPRGRSHPRPRRRGRAAPRARRAEHGEERREVRALGAAIACRAARLVGAALVGTLRFLDGELAEQRTIAVDGSLWGGYPGFEALVREILVELLGEERAGRIETAYVKDSTSAGAAVIAAVAATRRSE